MIIQTMVITCLIKIIPVILLLIFLCISSTYKHNHGTISRSFSDMNRETLGTIKPSGISEITQNGNIQENTSAVPGLPVSTTQSISVAFNTNSLDGIDKEATGKSLDGVKTDKDATRRNCNKESFDEGGCTSFLKRLVLKISPKDTWRKQLNYILKELRFVLAADVVCANLRNRQFKTLQLTPIFGIAEVKPHTVFKKWLFKLSGYVRHVHLCKHALCLHSNGSIVHLDPRTQICCNGLVNKTTYHELCCEGTLIDDRTHVCCNKSIHAKSDVTGCCGLFVYDKRENVCCKNSLHSIIPNMECCGNVTFNIKSQVCCHGNIQPTHGVRNKKGACCNATSYHGGCYVCNNLKLSARYDESTEVCCNGKIIERRHGNSSGCCHRRIINMDLEACKRNKIIPLLTPRLHTATNNSTQKRNVSFTKDENSITVILQKQGIPSYEETVVLIVPIATGIVCVVSVITLICICNGVSRRVFNYLWRGLTKRHLKSRKEALSEDAPCTQRLNHEATVIEDSSRKTVDGMENESMSLLEDTDLPEAKVLDTDTYTNDSASTENETVLLKMNYLVQKQDKTSKSNLLQNYFKDSVTQTGFENATFRRTIFGLKFDHTFMLDETNSCLTIPDSDVSLILPKSLTQNGQVEINCSSFDSLPDLRKKLGVSDDDVIASSVAEFVITGHVVLPEHASVMIPFVGKACDLIVKKFKSDEGLNTVATSVEIPERTKENEDFDVYYTIEGSFVIVYTNSFSGFYCTQNRHKRDVDLNLRAFIFGSYKRINRKFEVCVSTYIADDIFQLKSFQKRMTENEVERQEKVLLKEVPLQMPPCDLDDQDFIEIACLFTENGWMHRMHPVKNRPLQEERKEIILKDVAQKCTKCSNLNSHEVEIPFSTEWYLTTEENIVPSETFQFTVDLNICKRGSEPKENSIYIEALHLRSGDRLPVKEDYTRAMAPNQPVQETCNYGPFLQETERQGASGFPREQGHAVSLGNRMPNSDIVRGERSRLLQGHSFSESDLTRRQGLRQQPNPELSAPLASDQFQGLIPAVNESSEAYLSDDND